MEDGSQNLNQYVHPGLSEFVISEVNLLQVLNIELGTLRDLRSIKGFPVIQLNRTNRCYWIPDVLDWLKKHKSMKAM